MRISFNARGLTSRARTFRPFHAHQAVRHKFSGRLDAGRFADDATKSAAALLPTTPARTRFAPSPTGYLHIGSLRTALYNFLLARATGGQFVLRLEDTDQTRIVHDAETRLYEDLKWAGLDWDEGPDVGGPYGPYRQSERLSTYTKYAQQLLDEGRAYRCFCKPEDLDSMKAQAIQAGAPPVYNGTCSHIGPDVSARRAAAGEPHCVRFRCGGDKHSNNPAVHDLVYGAYKRPGAEELDDFILIKRDGYPTYHFANVVDDHLMEITHVVRGAEWLVSTPRHALLYGALGWRPPAFAHVGLLVDSQGRKLSKRHGDIDIASWRDRGVLPIALLNYVMLLGWSPARQFKKSQEVMDLDEMISRFHIKFTKGDITVNNKDEFFQKSHMRRLVESLDPDSFVHLFLPGFEASIKRFQAREDAKDQIEHMVPLARPGKDGDMTDARIYLRKVLALDAKSYRNPDLYLERNMYLLWQVPTPVYLSSIRKATHGGNGFFYREHQDGEQAPKHTPQKLWELVAKLNEILLPIEDTAWTRQHLEEQVSPLVKATFTGHGAPESHEGWGFHLLRWVLAGLQPGPALFPTMEIMGKKETMRRVEEAMNVAKDWEASSGRN